MKFFETICCRKNEISTKLLTWYAWLHWWQSYPQCSVPSVALCTSSYDYNFDKKYRTESAEQKKTYHNCFANCVHLLQTGIELITYFTSQHVSLFGARSLSSVNKRKLSRNNSALALNVYIVITPTSTT